MSIKAHSRSSCIITQLFNETLVHGDPQIITIAITLHNPKYHATVVYARHITFSMQSPQPPTRQ